MLRVLFAAFLLAVSFALESRALAQRAGSRPNIIFILTDDLGYGDFGPFFQNARQTANVRSEPWHFTPHLDSMAAQGLQMPHEYSAAPVFRRISEKAN